MAKPPKIRIILVCCIRSILCAGLDAAGAEARLRVPRVLSPFQALHVGTYWGHGKENGN